MQLRGVVQRIVDERPGKRLLLIMDPFEEIFEASVAHGKRQRFLDALSELLTNPGRWTWMPVFPVHLLSSPIVS